MAKVRDDKERESGDGFDGTWVAHPDLVPLATEVFDGVLGAAPNQKGRRREEVAVGADELLDFTVDGGRGHGGRGPREHPRRAGLPRLVAAGRRRRRDRQPHGGRGDGRDQPLAALAVDHAARRRSTTGRRSTRRATRRSATRSWRGSAAPARAAWPRPCDLLDRLVLDDDFADFLTLRAYAILE